MKAVILCGGQGTRIRDASETLPKPMLPIGGKPIVWHIMKSYAAHGVTRVRPLPRLQGLADQGVLPQLPGDDHRRDGHAREA